jgi:hypothetical protein
MNLRDLDDFTIPEDQDDDILVVVAADEGVLFEADAVITYARRPGADQKRFPNGVDEVIPLEECGKNDSGAFPVLEIKISGS